MKTRQQLHPDSLPWSSLAVGVILTAYTEKGNGFTQKTTNKDILFLVLTTIGYLAYSAFPKTITADAESMFLPQTLGILLGLRIYLAFSGNKAAFMKRPATLTSLPASASGLQLTPTSSPLKSTG